VTARSLDFHSQLRLNHCWELGCRLINKPRSRFMPHISEAAPIQPQHVASEFQDKIEETMAATIYSI
ncbi:mCG1046009, partial [Mus musculus]